MAGAVACLAPRVAICNPTPGDILRSARLARHPSMRDVVFATRGLAITFGNQEFRISRSHLSQIETRNMMPNLYRLHSLAMVYELDILTLMSWFVPETVAHGWPTRDP